MATMRSYISEYVDQYNWTERKAEATVRYEIIETHAHAHTYTQTQRVSLAENCSSSGWLDVFSLFKADATHSLH